MKGLKDFVLSTVKQFSGTPRNLSISTFYIDLVGDHIGALLLSQCIYWAERTNDPEGWFYKSAPEWYEELRISYYQLSRATKLLKCLGLETKIKKINGNPTLHYRINQDIFTKAILKFVQFGFSRNSKNGMRETSNSEIEVSCITSIYNRDDYIDYSQAPTEPGAPPTQEREGLCDLEVERLDEGNCSSYGSTELRYQSPSEGKYSAAAPKKSEKIISAPPLELPNNSTLQKESKEVAPDTEPWLDGLGNFKPEMVDALIESMPNLYFYSDSSKNLFKAQKTLKNMRRERELSDLSHLWSRAEKQIQLRQENERLRANLEIAYVIPTPPQRHRSSRLALPLSR